MRILTEASGSLTSGYLISAIQSAGHTAVASDIHEDHAGRHLAADFLRMPKASHPDLWKILPELLAEAKIDFVIPSLDETLLGWAERRLELEKRGIFVLLSDARTIQTFQDKWQTFEFFRAHGVATPLTSLSQDYALVKPRFGRGGKGVSVPDRRVDMTDNIAQELLVGEEITIDVFCDRDHQPVYIVPRKRLRVIDGKSTGGEVIQHPEIEAGVRRICRAIPFRGPINLQCFLTESGVIFTEINPRVAGGMALGFAATENWIDLAVRHFKKGEPISPVPVRWGMRMFRYYAEIFVPEP